MTSSLRRLCEILSLMFVPVLFPAAWAQEAGVVGTVTDPSGALIRGASIGIRNVETGLERQFSFAESSSMS